MRTAHNGAPEELTDTQLESLRRRLIETVARARTDLAAQQEDFAAIVAASTHSNADDEHDPEGATIAFERAQVSSRIEAAQATEAAAARALARWAAGAYGRCEICAAPIGYERLLARPATTRCIKHAS